MTESQPGILRKLPLQNVPSQKLGLAHEAALKDVADRKRVAREFASFLYLEVLKAMRATLARDGLFENDSVSRDMYSSMFDHELARLMANRDSEGLSKTVQQAIEKSRPMSRAKCATVLPSEGARQPSSELRDDRIYSEKDLRAATDVVSAERDEFTTGSGSKVKFAPMVIDKGNLLEIDDGGMMARCAYNAVNAGTTGEQIGQGRRLAP
jgi:Rod binding domain-containing protein